MAGGTNDPGKLEERAGEARRGKEARPLSPWPLPPVHTGACPTRGSQSSHYIYTYTHEHTHTHTTLLHTWVQLPSTGRRDGRSGVRCGKDARGLRGVRAALPAPSARARAAPRGSCSCANPLPRPAFPGGMTRGLGPRPG